MPPSIAPLLARARRLPLDRELADGADPTVCRQLAARAAQLTRPGTRATIARALERLALADEIDPGRWGVAPARGALRANRATLFELSERLRSDHRLYAQGIAMLELVAIDGTGPAYTDHRGEALARQLELAACALAG